MYVYSLVPLSTYTARYRCVGLEGSTFVYLYSEVALCTYTAG